MGALQRLAGSGGDPVVELQTTFGGGKTHSMLALNHLFSGAPIADLPGIEPILKEAGTSVSPKAKRAVFVGTAPSVADVREMPDGTRIHTMWGDLAWQLGEKKGYAIVAEADKRGVSPGSDALRQLLLMAAPCLILIDEWVAYVRLLYGVDGLPGGSFDSNLTFAQSLTEAARAVDKALLVATLPQSNIEVGGEGGAQALTRLEHTFRRTGAAWAPASAEESFEIVRRRLFEPIETAKNKQEFPAGCGEGEYERRLRDAYPVHPELFERLYGDWSTLDRFQRTRGVLRLMAEIIQALWERQDASLLIMPAHVPLDVGPVQNELTRYLAPPWPPVIDREVDGPNSLPLAIERENPNLGRYSATRRVARTVFLGSAPHEGVAHQGQDDRRIRLGCAQPGETVATFGDALRRLSDRAVHLFQDGAVLVLAPAERHAHGAGSGGPAAARGRVRGDPAATPRRRWRPWRLRSRPPLPRYLYLPRLRSPEVLREAIEAGLALVTWERETFAFAEGWDESAGRYRALRAGQVVRVDLDGEGLLVKPEVAARQREADGATPPTRHPFEEGEDDPSRRALPGDPLPPSEPPIRILRRFHGSVQLDPSRTGRDAGRIAEEVIQHLTTL